MDRRIPFKNLREISGPVSYFIFHFGHTKFTFIGDVHFSKEGSCDAECINLDSHFRAPENKNAECYTIAAYLDGLFRFNNANGIKTNFFLESFFVKKNVKNTFLDKSRRRLDQDEINVENFLERRDNLAILKVLFAPDFRNSYLPNVGIHYGDIRMIITTSNKVNYTDPFLLIFESKVLERFHDYIRPSNSSALDKLIEFYQSVEFLIQNSVKIFEITLSRNNFDHLIRDLQEKVPNNAFSDQIREILYMMKVASKVYQGVVMHRNAVQLIKLEQLGEGVLSQIIANYSTDKANFLIKISLDDLRVWYNKMRGLLLGTIPQNQDVRIMNFLRSLLGSLSSVSMDTYMLARMFRFQSQEVIVYAGSGHILSYAYFFREILRIIPATSIESKSRCIHLR